MEKQSGQGVTALLKEWAAGDRAALERLMPLVYEELRRLAHRFMRSERPGHTLQVTGLVNEAFVRMAGMNVEWADRAHFYAIAARSMRRILSSMRSSPADSRRRGRVEPGL